MLFELCCLNFVVGTALLELRCWNFVVGTSLFELRCLNGVVGKSVEDIRVAFAEGIRTKYILPLSYLFLTSLNFYKGIGIRILTQAY
jgi:hypothetical protein